MAGSTNSSPWMPGSLQGEASGFLNDHNVGQDNSFSNAEFGAIADFDIDPSLLPDFNFEDLNPETPRPLPQEHNYDGRSTTANEASALQTTADINTAYPLDNSDNCSVASGVVVDPYNQINPGIPTALPYALPPQPELYYGTGLHPQYGQSYLPPCHYPEQGLNGLYESQNMFQRGPAMRNPYVPYDLTYGLSTNQWNQHHLASRVPTSLEAPGACLSCGCKPHTGRCPSPTLPPQQPLQLPDVSQVESQGAAKRKCSYSYDDSYSTERATKAPRRSSLERHNRAPVKGKRGKRGKKGQNNYLENPGLVYTKQLGQVPSWTSPSGTEFDYTRKGQLESNIKFLAQELRDYVESCPRQLTIWLQTYPARVLKRLDPEDQKCRYAACPSVYGTILSGWFRVVFDEFPKLTSDGTKDPFKAAGNMHLWCFERCFDPIELFNTGVLVPDDRILPKETGNPWAITREPNQYIIERTLEPWIEARRCKGGPPQIPYARHEDSLSYALVKHQVAHQTGARQTTRNNRNAKKSEDSRKTIEYHLGRLDFFQVLAKNETRRRQGLPELPYEDDNDDEKNGEEEDNNNKSMGGETTDPPSADDATDAPLTEEQFDEYYARYKIKSNDTSAPVKKPQAEQIHMAADRFPTPKSPVLKAQDAIDVIPSPPDLDFSEVDPPQTNGVIVSPSSLFSPESVRGSPPSSSACESQEPVSFEATTNEQPGSKPESNGQVVTPPPMKSNLILPSGSAKQVVQGSPLRRSSRMSAKKTP